MDKLDLHSRDILGGNIEKIGELFPGVITETKDKNGTTKKAVDFDLLRQHLSDQLVEGDRERFRLDWPGKRESILRANTPITKTLHPIREDSVDFDTTQNIFIEGDNFEVLKVLQESYLGKIKMIYIDPPYNTGKDFIYKDNFTASKSEFEEELGVRDDETGGKLVKNTETNGRFHSDWLSMIQERLIVARDLLTDDGVILVHIDESEEAHLKVIMDDVFDNNNFLGNILWNKKNPKGDSTGISYQHESMLLYARQSEPVRANGGLTRSKANANKMLSKVANLVSKNGGVVDEVVRKDYKNWLKTQPFSGGEKAYSLIDDSGEIYRTVSMAWPNKQKAPGDYFKPLIHPITNKPCPVPDRGWRNPSATMKKLLAEGAIVFGEDEQKQPERKYLLKENLTENIASIYEHAGSDDALLKKLGVFFDNPKPVKVVQDVLSWLTKDSDTVLDFFSGSGTTAHAVMRLNAEDGGNRKHIQVQLAEPTDPSSEAYKAGYKTIPEISRERIRRAAKKIREDYAEQIAKRDTPLDTGFRAYKLSSSNFTDTRLHPNATTQASLLEVTDTVKQGRSAEDILTEVILDLGLTLDLPIESRDITGHMVYFVGGNSLVACFDDTVDVSIIDEIAKEKPLRVVLKDSSFTNDETRINIEVRMRQLSPETEIKVL